MFLEELKSKKDSYTALVVSPIRRLENSLIDMMRIATKDNVPILFLCINKPHDAINDEFVSKGIDTSKVLYVDCIAKSLGAVTRRKSVIHLDSASDLKSLELAVVEFLEKIEGKKYVIFDALATLLIYNSEDSVMNFVKRLIKNSAEAKTICFTPDAKGTMFINKASHYFDELVHLT